MERYIIDGKEVAVMLPPENTIGPNSIIGKIVSPPARVVKLGPADLICDEPLTEGPQTNSYVENWAEMGERYDIYHIQKIGDNLWRFWIGDEDQVDSLRMPQEVAR